MAETLKFPDNFFWGSATAAYQVEGGIENTDWAQAAREGKVPVCGTACDHYHLYEKDFDLLASLGHTAYRFSIEWARIEPQEGVFNDGAIEHYRNVIKALHVRNIKPYPCLWHFTLPQWFVDKGGFESRKAPELFARYCGYVAEKLGVDVTHFSTMNEPMVFSSNGWLRGTWPPFRKKAVFAYFNVVRNLTHAHNRAYDAIKRVAPHIEVGVVKHTLVFDANKNPWNRIRAKFLNWQWTHVFMSRVADKCDVIGLNYYIYKKFGDKEVYPKTDMGWNANPEKIYDALALLARYNKPLFVSEAGVADADDDMRADYIRGQVSAVHRAIQKGIDVRGHLYWSLLDNYEWAHGFDKRFGLIHVNYVNQERTVRPSAREYQRICESNTIIV